MYAILTTLTGGYPQGAAVTNTVQGAVSGVGLAANGGLRSVRPN
jgi:hypothetical protein